MDYVANILDRLAASRICGYHAQSPAATEPTALAALALLAHDRARAADPLVQRLLELQNEDGSLGVDRQNSTPGWPTGWAVLAWRAAQKSEIFAPEYVDAGWRGQRWILETAGDSSLPENWEGHDTRVRGWPWVAGTHSWIEPTAMNLLALKRVGQSAHKRAREAAALLSDRLLPEGGCNYGNTIVFGQALRPHLQPTGICLMALAGEPDSSGRIERSIAFLKSELSERTATASLAFGLLGMAAHGEQPREARDWLASAAHRSLNRDAGSYKLAILALAALGPECPLVTDVWSQLAPATTEALTTS